MRPLWNWLPLPCCSRGCCCDLVEAQELGLPVVGHPWVDECLQLPDPPSFFGFAVLVDGDGLPGCGLLEVLLLW